MASSNVLCYQRLMFTCRPSPRTRSSSSEVVSPALCQLSPTSKSSLERHPLTVFYCTAAAHCWPWTSDLDLGLDHRCQFTAAVFSIIFKLTTTLAKVAMSYYWPWPGDLDLELWRHSLWWMTDGLLLYSGYTGELDADFISMSLTQRYVEFRFSLGTGSAIIRFIGFNPQLIQIQIRLFKYSAFHLHARATSSCSSLCCVLFAFYLSFCLAPCLGSPSVHIWLAIPTKIGNKRGHLSIGVGTPNSQRCRLLPN